MNELWKIERGDSRAVIQPWNPKSGKNDWKQYCNDDVIWSKATIKFAQRKNIIPSTYMPNYFLNEI